MPVQTFTAITPIEALKLSPRPYNALVRAGLDTVEKVRASDYRLIRGVGSRGTQQIEAALTSLPSGPKSAEQPPVPTLTDDEIATILQTWLRRWGKRSKSGQFDSRAGFAAAAGVNIKAITRFLTGRRKRTSNRSARSKIEREIRRRGWVDPVASAEEAGTASPSASQSAPEATSELPPINYPYPDLQESDPRHTYKLLVNTCADALAKNPRHPKRDEIEKQMAAMKEMAETPEGYYPASALYNANPIHKLTSDEKLLCIRTLPVEIVKKLFPNL